MRNISFSLTEPQFLDGSKTVTRRLGWQFLRPGDRLMGCRKCMGLKPGESIVRLGEIEVVSVRREPLNFMLYSGSTDDRSAYGDAEADLEGFPNLVGWEFVKMFCDHMKCQPSTVVTRIEFRHV